MREDWGKSRFLEVACEMCRPIFDCYSPDASTVVLPNRVKAHYTDEIADFECFARPLWAAAAIVRNGNRKLGKTIFSMIRNGVNPNSENYWGRMSDYDHKIVETASVAWFLYVNRTQIDDEFSDKDMKNLVEWLLQINRIQILENNWCFFGIIVNAVLISLGREGSREKMMRFWACLDKHYIGDGWYNDGRSAQRDYYIAFAYHFYSLLWVYIDDGIDKEVRNAIIDRAESFAAQYGLFFDACGAQVPYGRSLTYRFACVAFYSAYKLVGLDGVSDSEAKGFITRNLQYWMHQPIFSDDGFLNVGYVYENTNMKEKYNATGSPYWAMKAFVILLLPDEARFWTAIPPESLEDYGVTTIAYDKFVASRNFGIVSLYPLNMRAKHDYRGGVVSKYEKYVYSSRHGFCVPTDGESLNGSGTDSTVSVAYDGKHWICKNKSHEQLVGNNLFTSVWYVDGDTHLTSWICVLGTWHIRIHIVHSNRRLSVADCGFCIPSEGSTIKMMDGCLIQHNESVRLCAGAASLAGDGEVACFDMAEDSNVCFRSASVAGAFYDVRPGKTVIASAFFSGINQPDALPSLQIRKDKATISYKGEKIEIKLMENRNVVFFSDEELMRRLNYAKYQLNICNRLLANRKLADAHETIDNLNLMLRMPENLSWTKNSRDVEIRGVYDHGVALRPRLWGEFRTISEYMQMLKNWHGFMKEHSDCKDLYITGYKNFLNDARAFVAGQEHNGVPHIELAELETALKNGWRGLPSKVRVRKRVQDVKAIHKLLIAKTWKIIKKS